MVMRAAARVGMAVGSGGQGDKDVGDASKQAMRIIMLA
jgi:hypothetical protein